METLKELFEETLKDIYFAEKTIVKSLPKMAKKTKSPDLKRAFEEHAEQTKGQIERLDEIFKLLGKKASGKECPAILGLVTEAEEIMEEAKSPDVLNAGLVGCAQAVEHYEIARYGTLRAWAKELQMPEAVKLLEATLAEEKSTDEKLSQLAVKGGINAKADEADAKADEPAPKSAAGGKAAAGAKVAPSDKGAQGGKSAPSDKSAPPSAKSAPADKSASGSKTAPVGKTESAKTESAKTESVKTESAKSKPKLAAAAPSTSSRNGASKAPARKA